MKKMNNRGFVLAETLIVTSFVAGVLIFLFIQFTNISNNYETSYKYNTVEDLYALQDIRDYIYSDSEAFNTISNELVTNEFLNITDCGIFLDKDYCLKLFELEGVDQVIVSNNYFNYNNFSNIDSNLSAFVKKISSSGEESYRLIVSFKNLTYATLRFGE